MPGTIMVSVLEFMDLPFSSSTSIRASLGKIEYQVSDKGNFSFPLTSLRDDLIFKIQDADGKEISRAGVHIRMILEKGVWEDMFPLGEGQLHLKLQVVLSDHERDRIRMMRQSALKKKQDELLNSTIIRNAALLVHTTDEVSESSPKQYLQHEEVSQIQSPVASSNDDKESSSRNVVEAQLEPQQQINSNIADQYKKTSTTKPVSQEVSITQLQNIGKKPANQSPPKKHPQRVTSSEELVNLLSLEKIKVVRNNLEDDGLQNTEKKVPPKRTPSNVMKMISAFESGMPKDMRPHIKPPPTKYQVNPIEKKDSSETQNSEQGTLNIEPRGVFQEKAKSASLVRNMQQVPEHIGESKEQINTLNRKTDSNARNTDQEEETNNKVSSCSKDQEEEKNNRNLMATSTFETVTVSGKMPLKEEKRRDKDSEVSYIEKDLHNNYYKFGSSEAMILQKMKNMEKNAAYIETGIEESKYERIENIEESKTNTSSDDNGDENSGGPFNQVISSTFNEVSDFSSRFLFDESRACKNIIMNLWHLNYVGTPEAQHDTAHKVGMSVTLARAFNCQCRVGMTHTLARAFNIKFRCYIIINIRLSAIVEECLFSLSYIFASQVIRVAIIIGFGLLVLLTRQRKKRKEKSA